MKAERNYSLDLIRILACVMVVLTHTPLPSDNANGLFLSAISYLTAPDVCLFFMVSGALLLPTKLSMSEFLRRRLSKLICPTIFWTLVYILLSELFAEPSNNSILRSLLSIPFSPQGSGVLWFMYTLIGFYIIIPIISPWIKRATGHELVFCITLFLITCCFPYLKQIVDINSSETGILYYLSGYGGYFLLGYFMNKYWSRLKLWQSALLFLACISIPIVVRWSGLDVDFYEMFWYLSLPVAIMCICWWRWLQPFNKYIIAKSARLKNVISNLSGMSFGIYLCHIAIMRFILWKLDIIINIENYIIQTALIFAATLLLSIAFTYLICRTPLGRYIVGFEIKN